MQCYWELLTFIGNSCLPGTVSITIIIANTSVVHVSIRNILRFTSVTSLDSHKNPVMCLWLLPSFCMWENQGPVKINELSQSYVASEWQNQHLSQTMWFQSLGSEWQHQFYFMLIKLFEVGSYHCHRSPFAYEEIETQGWNNLQKIA